MASIHFEKRDWCYGYGCGSGAWTWARWLLFVLFILGLILVVISAIRINKRRSQEGRQPIRGTAWITPPSYLQSQNQTQNPPFVPQYTEHTNDNDMGYYDAEGVFHPNPKAREAFHLNTLVPDQTGTTATGSQAQTTGGVGSSGDNGYAFQPPPGPPPPAATAGAPVHTTGQDENLDFERDFSRYYETPQQRREQQPGETGETNSDTIYQRPDVPPPAVTHTKQ